MSLVVFRATVLVIVFLGAVSALVDAFGPLKADAVPGTYGIEWNAIGNRTIVATKVDAGSPAANAGIHAHDTVKLEPEMSFYGLRATKQGDVARFTVPDTNGRSRKVSLTAVEVRPGPFDAEWAFIRLLTVAVALFVAFAARPSNRPARALAMFLACIGLLGNWALYPGALAMGGFVLRAFGAVYGFPHFLIFAARLSSGTQNTAPRHLFGWSYERIAVLLGGVYAALTIGDNVLFLRSTASPWISVASIVVTASFFALGLSALAGAYGSSLGVEHQRLRWIFATMVISLTGAVAWLVLGFVPFAPPWRDNLALTMIALPVGLAYAILKHRVLDISFAINRAIVFATIATLLVPFFGLIEWSITEAVNDPAHRGGLIAFFSDPDHRLIALTNAAASVLVFATLRFVHERIDDFVRKFLFQARDAMLAELKRSTRDVLYVNDPQALAQHIVGVCDEKFCVKGTTVYYSRDDAFERVATSNDTVPASIDGNDPGVLRLKSIEQPILLGRLSTAIPGAYAVPFTSGRRLSGFCAIPYGPAEEMLAPDELQGAFDLARCAAFTLDDLRIRALEAQLADLRGQLQRFTALTPAHHDADPIRT